MIYRPVIWLIYFAVTENEGDQEYVTVLNFLFL